MVTVINGDLLQKHNVGKYNFKVIALGSENEKNKPKESENKYTPENHPAQRATDHVDSSALSDSSKESLIESLMQKTDEMSSNFIKLQMKLESKEEEFTEALKKAKEEAFAEGIEAGKAQAQNELNEQVQNSLGLYETSIEKLEKSAKTIVEGMLVFDGKKLGVEKILGVGELHRKAFFKNVALSKKAVQKIQKAGGKIELVKRSEEVQR